MTLRPEHIEEALNKKTFDEIDPDEVLKHYGYKPEEVHCNGVGIGVWRKEEAFQKLGDIGAFMRFVDHKAKARIEFNYDPDFPAALLITHAAMKNWTSSLQERHSVVKAKISRSTFSILNFRPTSAMTRMWILWLQRLRLFWSRQQVGALIRWKNLKWWT